jgi:hypothetical protein
MTNSRLSNPRQAPPMDENSDLEAALESQQWLLETSLPLVFDAYDDALKRKVKDPVVLLLDCEDAIGGEFARSWLGDAPVEDAITHHAADDPSDDETTVFAIAFALTECQREIPPVFPYLKPALKAPASGFLAVSVTSGGASVLIVPNDARPENAR